MSLFLLFIFVMVLVTIAQGEKAKRIELFFSRKWLIFGYALVLLASVFVYQIIPTADEATGDTVSPGEENQFYTEFHEAARKGEIDQVERSIKVEEWVFDYEQPKIHVKSKHNNPVAVSVVLERKQTNDGKIEAYYYTATSRAGNIDITDAVARIDLEVEGSSMILIRPTIVERHYAQFTPEFTTAQFMEEENLSNGHHTQVAPEILHVKIPKDLEVIDYAGVVVE